MPVDLGAPLTGVFNLAAGQAQLFERGLTVDGADGQVVVSFAFPMIGRPSIVTGSSAPTSPFGADVIHFHPGNWSPQQLNPLILEALAGRLALVATGRPDVRAVLTAERVDVVEPERDPCLGGPVAPAVHAVATSSPELLERQLYDVAVLADGGQWHVVAPHAVYHRQAWTDFGIAHITDMHVARRIDRFRDILEQAGRTEAAQRMYNWNDRFRGFVKYANYLHSIGVLDVIVATGDVFDYLFEDDDDPRAGGNAAFLRRLILGQAPGPDFPEVEELLVPVFMVPGNHDYRKHPYKLLFDVRIGGGPVGTQVKRIRNYAPYRLAENDALVLGHRLAGTDSPVSNLFVPNVDLEGAARMVEVDPGIAAYRTFLADRGSYTVRLGRHRIVMIDTAHDVGMVTSLLDGVRAFLGSLSEDEATFVGGSPNCEGVTACEFDMVREALAEPGDGLFIVGLHAPLFNPPNDEYPYFLRQTQRPHQLGQVHGFLARHGGTPVSALTPREKQVERHHPHWFPGDHDHRDPAFVKRVDSQDLLENGVSRGRAETLMGLLVGSASNRPADVVLAGHTHCHNEFIVRRMATGELAYYMDFYTQNPVRYYPTRFTRSWRPGPGQTVAPVTDKTHVEVVPEALPDATPWPLPMEDDIDNQLQVPPYATPLSAAPDPRVWWAEHRPVVLQTGALGPFKILAEFAGFRLLTVKNDVIDKVHFVSTERLEAKAYELDWQVAIRPEPRRHRYIERSRPLGAPAAGGSPSGIVFPSQGVTNVVYQDFDGRLHEIWSDAAGSGTSNLTELAGNATRAVGDPTSFITTDGLEIALYRGTDGHVHSLYWSTGPVGHDALGAKANAPKTAGKPAGFVQKDGTNVVIYRAQNGHLHSLWWTGMNPPSTADLMPAGAPAAAGDPAPYINSVTGENIVAYRGSDKRIHSLFWTGPGAVGHDDLSGSAGAPNAAGDPVAYYTAHDDRHQVTYRSQNGQIHELGWTGADPVLHKNLTVLTAAAPPAESDPVAYYSAGTNTKHVIYRSKDGHLHEFSWKPGATPAHTDLTSEALAPLAAYQPSAFTVEGPNTQHVVYRGQDGQIHEIRWTLDEVAAPVQRDWRWCNRCQGLFYGPEIGASSCPAGGTHNANGSANYGLFYGGSPDGRQSEWRWCDRCQGLFYGPEVGASRCPTGATHSVNGSANYSLSYAASGQPGRQDDWRWCNRCQGLFYGPEAVTSRCPAGGAHAAPPQSGSANYSLVAGS